MPINVDASSQLLLGQTCSVSNAKTFPFYGDYQDAKNYFSIHMYFDVWQMASKEEHIAALVTSTKAIDRLNFNGQKIGDLQFPRIYGVPFLVDPSTQQATTQITEIEVPRRIVEACYENTIMLLKGIEPETEIRNLSATYQGFSGHITRYDRSFVPPYLQAGIVSAAAWANLTPYLRDGRSLELIRVS